ncbi:MAG TPA: hypothetical protein VFQ67_01055 [Allosphingosinicella sp.]|jgi:hypothetical protein|nr:hypothetical protein [Allosphingosinicella sp.]
MALWQFEFEPVPASRATARGAPAIHLARDILDGIELDLRPDEQQRLFDEFDGLLPEMPAWAAQMRRWGDEKRDDIQVYLESDRIVGLRIRLDVSNISMPLVGGICRVARSFDWVFASAQGTVFPATLDAVVRAAAQSRASQFVADPAAYLQRAVDPDQAAGPGRPWLRSRLHRYLRRIFDLPKSKV